MKFVRRFKRDFNIRLLKCTRTILWLLRSNWHMFGILYGGYLRSPSFMDFLKVRKLVTNEIIPKLRPFKTFFLYFYLSINIWSYLLTKLQMNNHIFGIRSNKWILVIKVLNGHNLSIILLIRSNMFVIFYILIARFWSPTNKVWCDACYRLYIGLWAQGIPLVRWCLNKRA